MWASLSSLVSRVCDIFPRDVLSDITASMSFATPEVVLLSQIKLIASYIYEDIAVIGQQSYVIQM